MAIKKNEKKLEAHLIKYREAHMEDPIWFWVNPNSGSTLSPKFASQEEAEKWFDDIVSIFNETYLLIDRAMTGKIYTLKGKVDIGDLISSKKADECPFTLHLEDDILVTEVLGLNIMDARERVEQYIEILEWIE